MTDTRVLSEDQRRKLSEAGKKGALSRWKPDDVVKAVESGTPIPAAPVKRADPGTVPSTPPELDAGPAAEAEQTEPGKVGGGAASARPGPTPDRPPFVAPLKMETPPATGGAAPPSWYTAASISLPTDAKSSDSTSEDFELGSGMIVDTIGMVHDWAADESGYEGWRLKPAELELWRKVIRFALRKLPMKDWPIIGVIVALAIMEGKKIVGWTRWRKKMRGPTRPTKAPPEEPAIATVADIPQGAYMAPGRRRASA